MNNLKTTDTEISWDTEKVRDNTKFTYKTTIRNHGDHVSVNKIMYVNGDYKRDDLTHIPIQLISKIKDLKVCE